MEFAAPLLDGDATVLPGAEPAAATDPPPLAPGAVIGAYRVDALIGEGGMGRVYRAVHQKLDRVVALKVLRPGLADQRRVVGRFFDEARAVNRINHPNIIEVTDFLEPAGGPTCYVMEHLSGETLRDALAGGAMDKARVLRVMGQVADALAAAHRAGIIHRDLKPDNVFLTTRGPATDVVKLLDFGVACLDEVGGEDRQTIVGTPAYMAPEQLAGREVDERSDIFSFGLLLYEMLSGTRCAAGKNASALLVQYAQATPQLAAVPGADRLDRGLVRLTDRCLAKSPADRPATMAEVRDALAAMTLPVRAAPWRWAAAAGAVLVAGALWWGARPAPADPAPVVVEMGAPVPAPPTSGRVFFSSEPSGAAVTRAAEPDRVLCTTPCAAEVPFADRAEVVFQRGADRVAVAAALSPGAMVQAVFPPAPSARKDKEKQVVKPRAGPSRPAPKPVPRRPVAPRKPPAKKSGRTVIFDPFAG